MYERMFQNPDIRDLFNQSHHGETGSQPKALAAAVVAYARNIDNLGALASRVERIAQKHVGLNILPEHYPAVAESLLGAIKGRARGRCQSPIDKSLVLPVRDVTSALSNAFCLSSFENLLEAARLSGSGLLSRAAAGSPAQPTLNRLGP